MSNDYRLNLLSEELDKYKAAVLKLTEENERLKKRQITKNGFICDCEQNVKYRQALEEIKEIANKAINSDDCYERMYAGRMYCKPILTKINEVLDER